MSDVCDADALLGNGRTATRGDRIDSRTGATNDTCDFRFIEDPARQSSLSPAAAAAAAAAAATTTTTTTACITLPIMRQPKTA